MIFCTLFDCKYIDKGLALYESLYKFEDNFKLYIFAFDRITSDILTNKNLKNVIIINIKDIETKKMIEVKKERSDAEYCWTCTPIIIEYVLEHFNEVQCTYLDADIYFFASPKKLLSEITDTEASVIITEHRFPPDIIEKRIKQSGKYCVQFNTFVNDEKGREVLKWWKERCLEWCYYMKKGDKYGDQKYQDSWTSLFEGVHELQHLGGGVGPFNVRQYKLKETEEIKFSFGEIDFSLIFYHFQNIRYLPFDLVNTNLKTYDTQIIKKLYIPYLRHIEKIRKELREKYGLKFSIKNGYYTNPILHFIQDYIMPFRIRSPLDIFSIRKLRKELNI